MGPGPHLCWKQHGDQEGGPFPGLRLSKVPYSSAGWPAPSTPSSPGWTWHPPPWSSQWEPVVPRRAEEPESRCLKVPVGELGDSSSQKNPVISFRLPAFLAYSFSSSTTPPPLAPPEAFLGEAIRSPSGQEDLPAHDQIQATLGAKKAPHSPATIWERQNPGPVWAFEYLALES